ADSGTLWRRISCQAAIAHCRCDERFPRSFSASPIQQPRWWRRNSTHDTRTCAPSTTTKCMSLSRRFFDFFGRRSFLADPAAELAHGSSHADTLVVLAGFHLVGRAPNFAASPRIPQVIGRGRFPRFVLAGFHLVGRALSFTASPRIPQV